MNHDFIENQNWRYATKKFDATKKISVTDLEFLKEAIRLSASSYGLQLYKIFIVENPEVRTQLKAVAWNQTSITDASHLFVFAIENHLTGAFNAVTACTSNKNFMQALAKQYKKPFWFPNVPSFMLKLIFGEMSTVLLDGVFVSNQKMIDLGFKFKRKHIESALN